LSPLYKGLNDKAIAKDLELAEGHAAELAGLKGKLAGSMPKALELLIKISEISAGVCAYLTFLSSCDVENQDIKKAASAAQERLAKLEAGLAFFDIEVGGMSDEEYRRVIEPLTPPDLLRPYEDLTPTRDCKTSLRMRKIGRGCRGSHGAIVREAPSAAKAFLDNIRKRAKYMLTEKEEGLLALLSPFGGAEWDDTMDELESRTKFTLAGKRKTLEEILTTMNSSKDAKERFAAMKELNSTLASSGYAWLRTRALNLVAGKKSLLDAKRGFKGPMQSQNLSNNLDDATVEALHDAVRKFAVPQIRRYYRNLAKLLGKKKLLWSDRNAPLPFSSDKKIGYGEALSLVLSSYRAFSPEIADILEEVAREGRIDAPNFKGKTSGAYNYTIVAKGGRTLSYVLLNYLGRERDVMTLAHELGHAAHGMLAGRAQGALMHSAPTAYAETASIFGEMLAFEKLLAGARPGKERLALLMGKCNDWINSVGRQICFSEFEQELHLRRREGKLSEADLNEIWVRKSKEFYGDIFDYKHMESLWSYVGHFMRPFYVYSYAFGELFTQSLYAKRDMPEFEKLYIGMLASGGTRDAAALMAPFGLNPKDADFWKKGIECSIARWLDEIERLI